VLLVALVALTTACARPERRGAFAQHEVRAGETLGSIAKLYGVEVGRLAELNGLRNVNHIEVGQHLRIPDRPRRLADSTIERGERPPDTRRETKPAPVGARGDPGVERARALLGQATGDYREARFEAALAKARDAEAALAGSGDPGPDPALRARAAFVQGSALAALGERERAGESFARVHELDPHFEPPPGWLSPSLEELYTTASD
jgi:LysM repeat protein